MAHVLYNKGRAFDPADDDRMGAQPDGNRHSSRRKNRVAFLHRSRHWRGHWRNVRDRLAREALSWGHARSAEFPKGRAGQEFAKAANGIPPWKMTSRSIQTRQCSAARPWSARGTTIGGNVFLLHSVPPDSLVYYEAKQIAGRPETTARRSRKAQRSARNDLPRLQRDHAALPAGARGNAAIFRAAFWESVEHSRSRSRSPRCDR